MSLAWASPTARPDRATSAGSCEDEDEDEYTGGQELWLWLVSSSVTAARDAYRKHLIPSIETAINRKPAAYVNFERK